MVMDAYDLKVGGTVSNIYTHILQDKFGFGEVDFEGLDSHAYYFSGYYDDFLKDIKIRIDGEELEVWSRNEGFEDWHYFDSIIDSIVI